MSLDGRTRIYGLIGQPVAHSLSPRLMNDAFQRLDVPAVYLAFPTQPDQVAEALAGLRALGVAGVSVTYPLKTAVVPLLDSTSPAVKVIGAANTIKALDGGKLHGENTDAGGLVLALRELADLDPTGKHAVILGAGGAARAAVYGLLEAKAASVTLAVRSPERAEAGLVELRQWCDAELSVVKLESPEAMAALSKADLVVQATPVGLDDPDAKALIKANDAPRSVGFELNYGPRPSGFQRAWSKAGRRCLDGRDLLTAQAWLALQVWLDEAPELKSMRSLIDETTGTSSAMPPRNIVLTGFMGTGKTAIGRHLATLLGRPFLDLDAVIVQQTGQSIPEIFATDGEAHFRQLECDVAATLSTLPGLVLATGGGTLLDPRNRQALTSTGDLVTLTCSADELAGRLSTTGDRPLLSGVPDLVGRIEELLTERAATYAGILLTLDTSGRSPESVATELAAMLTLPMAIAEIPVPGAIGHPVLAARGVHTSRVVAGRGAACQLGTQLVDRGIDGQVVMVMPAVVQELYEPRLVASLEAAGLPWQTLVIDDDDQQKTFAQAATLVDRLAALGADRQTCLVAVGGGVTGDLAGFAASIYMRGIALVMVPTTLLAQVDASIGGKTAVNTEDAKNLAGAFHPPLLVTADPCLLASLPDRELAGGLAEVVKTALIGDPELFVRLEYALTAGDEEDVDPRRDLSLLEDCVTACAAVKGGVVGRDPWELDERRLLNLGHTVGHALEAQRDLGLSHGEAVSLGLMVALRLSVIKNLADPALMDRTRSLLKNCGLPTTPPEFDLAAVRARLRLDKKRRDGCLQFVLPIAPGNLIIEPVTDDEALAALAEEQACASS